MIRRAGPNDIPAILRLLDQVNRVHYEGRPDLFRRATKYGEAELGELLIDPAAPVFVETDPSGAMRGHAFCQIQETVGNRLLCDCKTLYIDDICVDEKARGKHVGKALYEYVRDYAKSIGCHHITLNVWEGNEPACAFYRNMGMQVQKTTMEMMIDQTS